MDLTLTLKDVIELVILGISLLYMVFGFKFRIEEIEKWIKMHQACADKQDAVVVELREAVAFLRGQHG
jgi:hypothetical protein